jgi:hypothetical protein
VVYTGQRGMEENTRIKAGFESSSAIQVTAAVVPLQQG